MSSYKKGDLGYRAVCSIVERLVAEDQRKLLHWLQDQLSEPEPEPDKMLGNELPTLEPNLFPNIHAHSDGTIEEKWIKRAGKLHGPYRYLRYRENGRLKSKYLGKAPNSGVSH